MHPLAFIPEILKLMFRQKHVEECSSQFKNWGKSTRPSVSEGLNKPWYIHILDYYSAIKRKN